jgi:uncharacterized protein (UPF0276 family)
VKNLAHPHSTISGIGIGLRAPHLKALEDLSLQQVPFQWMELLAENHLEQGGWVRQQTLKLAKQFPMTLHCVGLNIGGVAPFDWGLIDRIESLSFDVDSQWLSDHLCFTGDDQHPWHDLLPLPYTEEALAWVCHRVLQLQDRLKRPILLENPSRYVEHTEHQMREGEFLSELVKATDCQLLVDVNNLYVNQYNCGCDPEVFMDDIPKSAVTECHLAGFSSQGSRLLDTHNHPVADPVWVLYQRFCQRFPGTPTLIEWDQDIPPLATLMAEVERADRIYQSVLERQTFYGVEHA